MAFRIIHLVSIFLFFFLPTISAQYGDAFLYPIADTFITYVGPLTSLGNLTYALISNVPGQVAYAFMTYDVSSVTSDPANCISAIALDLVFTNGSVNVESVTFNITYVNPNTWSETNLVWSNQTNVQTYTSQTIQLYGQYDTPKGRFSNNLNVNSWLYALDRDNQQVIFCTILIKSSFPKHFII